MVEIRSAFGLAFFVALEIFSEYVKKEVEP